MTFTIEKTGTDHLRDFCYGLTAKNGEFAVMVSDAVLMTLDRDRKSGTMKSWFQNHHGDYVTTIQVTNVTGEAWAPTSRVVDSSRSTYVTLKGSARYYAGMRVIAVTDCVLIVADEWHTIAYFAEMEN